MRRLIKTARSFSEVPSDINRSMKRKRPPIALCLDKELFKWVTDKNKSIIAVNGEFIEFQAKHLLTKASIRLPADLRINL